MYFARIHFAELITAASSLVGLDRPADHPKVDVEGIPRLAEERYALYPLSIDPPPGGE